MSSENSASELLQLNPVEARVLGVLMEKQLTTPDAYPLTLNSLQTACNQKTSREPVMNLTPAQVQQAVNDLRGRKLVEVDYGSRADRYHQLLTRVLYLEKPQQALVSIMLLRGPQTVAELFTRTQRMTEFASADAVGDTLQVMCQKSQPVIKLLSRQSGQREDRYMHLLSGEPKLTTSRAETQPLSSGAQAESATNSDSLLDELLNRVEKLEAQVQALTEQSNGSLNKD